MFIPLAPTTDRLVWSKAISDVYTIADGYRLLSNQVSDRHNTQRIFPWKDFWRIKELLRLLMFIWKFLNESIPCGEILNRHHVPGNFHCQLCDHPGESLDHVFKACPFARAIWFGIPIALHMEDIREPNIVDWLRNRCIKHLNDKVEEPLL